MLAFFRAYPGRTILMLFALLLAGIAEGIGLSALLPLLNIAISKDPRTGGDNQEAADSEFERVIIDTLEGVGIQPSIGTLLFIIVIVASMKSFLLLAAKKQVGYTAAQVATDLRLEMLRVVLKSNWEYFIRQPIGWFLRPGCWRISR